MSQTNEKSIYKYIAELEIKYMNEVRTLTKNINDLQHENYNLKKIIDNTQKYILVGRCDLHKLSKIKQLLVNHIDIYGLIKKNRIFSKRSIIFEKACENNHSDILKLIIDLHESPIHVNINSIFIKACMNGYYRIAKLIHDMKNSYEILSIKTLIDGFDIACMKEFTTLIEFFILDDIKLIDINQLIQDILLKLVFNKKYKALECLFLHRLGYIISLNNRNLFVKSCELGYLDMLKYLLKYINYNLHFNNEELLILSCANNHINIVKYLIESKLIESTDKININIDDNKPFIIACINGNLEIAKYLYELSCDDNLGYTKINPASQDNKAFKKSHGKYMDISEWLIAINPKFIDLLDVKKNSLFEFLFSS